MLTGDPSLVILNLWKQVLHGSSVPASISAAYAKRAERRSGAGTYHAPDDSAEKDEL